jgi:4a-hydroxytetrahydrobiopterin dehydratase
MYKKIAHKECIPCEKAKRTDVLTLAQAKKYLAELKEWKLVKKGKAIEKEYVFPNFVKAMAFVDQVADVAEGAGHHPDIYIWYNKVHLEFSTHSIGGLSQNDFIVASRVDQLWLV